MANPSQVSCAADAWTKVVTNKTKASVYLQIQAPPRVVAMQCVYVARKDTGEAAPTDLTTAVLLSDNTVELNASVASDLYLYPVGAAITVVVDA